MYAASGLWAVEYSEIRLNKVHIFWGKSTVWFLRLTLSQRENQDHRTILKYSCPKFLSRRNNRCCCYNIRQRVLFLYSFQDQMWFDACTLKIQPNGNIHHRTWIEKGWKERENNDLRLAGFVGIRTKTYHNVWSGIKKCVARWTKVPIVVRFSDSAK